MQTVARAGHAHAGVLVTLGLVTLMSAGFFFSSMGRGEVVRPNRWIWLVWLGAAAPAVGVLTLGTGLLRT